jgi:hypothetical protein
MTRPVSRTIGVADAEGKPLGGALVALVWLYAAGNPEDPNRVFRSAFSVYANIGLAASTSDAEGKATIYGLPDTECSFWASRAGFADGICLPSCSDSRITLTRGATVAGRVVTDTGEAIEGVEVAVCQLDMYRSLTGPNSRRRHCRNRRQNPPRTARTCKALSFPDFLISPIAKSM